MTTLDSGDIGTMGLFLDIFGAFFLAQGFIIKSAEATVVEASDYMDGNPYRLRSAIYQRIEAWTGFIFLFIGFALQLSTYQSFVTKGSNDNVSFTMGVPVVLVLCTILITNRLKKRLAYNAINTAFNFKRRVALELTTKRSMKSEDQQAKAAKFYGEVIGIKRKNSETVDRYIDRVLKSYQ